jgi:hypothetical protein
MKRLGLVLLTCFAVAGCATTFQDVAPAGDGSLYVVGSSENMPAVWRCPPSPGRGRCERVTVKE